LSILVIRKRQPIRLSRPGDCGTVFGERRDRARDVRELVVLVRVQIVQEDVRGSCSIRHVGDGSAVGRPLRIDVESGLTRQHRRRSGREIEQRDLPRLEVQVGEARAVAIAGEGDRPAVGRPLRLQVAELVVRQLLEVRTISVY
jgi:hypothetical protein